MTIEGERASEVAGQMNELDVAIASLASTLDGLEPGLEKALRINTTAGEDKMQPQEGLCPLAHEIRSFRYRIENMSARVRDILSRLEL